MVHEGLVERFREGGIGDVWELDEIFYPSKMKEKKRISPS